MQNDKFIIELLTIFFLTGEKNNDFTTKSH